ncbi:hypothetical protein KI688_006573 [Linnemannia hyalina]|uniref:Uncharacterized protein n=1 Tax=Linnemannia hyalina TaxID=64524 RepID=A0A9P7XJI7_9FUNG|nr:hypothetical protein KI688_006573 [Linnemannia hyalina]
MKTCMLLLILPVSIVAQDVVCGGFPPAALGDCLQLINQNVGKLTPAPVEGSHAVISVGTCAISTQPSPGQSVTMDYLAKAGNAIYEVCDAPDISGFQGNPIYSRTCMLESQAFALC